MKNHIFRSIDINEVSQISKIKGNEGSTKQKRRSLNIPHYTAVQNAFSNLARIDDFNLEDLGSGFFSDVFKVTHKLTGQVMVLKKNKDTNNKRSILRELQLMNRLSHPNILKLKGACVDEGQIHALTEYINGGDLDQLILNNIKLSWNVRIRLSMDIALGMNYLHSCGIFHRDLSAKNCLVRVMNTGRSKQTPYSCVVADFGLAEKVPTNETEIKILQEKHSTGCIYVVAPEVIHSKPYDQTADVFSFGIMLCQLIARLPCDPDKLPRSNDFGLSVDQYQGILKSIPPSIQSAPPPQFLQLAFDCCKVEPKLRPTFKEIISRLTKIREEIKHSKSLSNENSFADENKLVLLPSKDVVKRRKNQTKRNSNSRLSMSFSDLSWELINHAAQSSNQNNKEMQSSGGFSNPFAALECLNGQTNRKLSDEPSCNISQLNLENDRKKLIKSHPRYSLYGDSLKGSGVHGYHDIVTCQLDEYNAAVHRAMLLSPSGRGLNTWWRAHRSSTTCEFGCEQEDQNNFQKSNKGFMQALSQNSRHMKRMCISIPNDLNKLDQMFYCAYDFNFYKTSKSSEQVTTKEDKEFASVFPTPPDSPQQKILLKNKSSELLNNKKQASFDSCCCTVKITPHSKSPVPKATPQLHDDLVLCHNSSWTSCMCGMSIPYLSYSDTAS